VVTFIVLTEVNHFAKSTISWTDNILLNWINSILSRKRTNSNSV